MRNTVYLAGGFRSGWQDELLKIEGFKFIDPRSKELRDGEKINMPVQQYGQWDLHFIRNSDIVFVYAEHDNKSCIGLSVEAGYAKGLGKTVILVLEPNDTIKNEYLVFLTQVADITFSSFEQGVDYLKSFSI